MNGRSIHLGFILAGLLCFPMKSFGDIIYTIGNSLTVVALYNYQGTYQYSIQCNQNLQTIFENPAGRCPGDVNPNAFAWDLAFAQKSYDFVTVQPFYFTTLDQDFNAISTWMNLQPNAKFILHTGWPNVSAPSVYSQPLVPGGQFVHSKAHIDALVERIQTASPNRAIGNTNIIGTLESIRLDILAGTSPIASLNDLYRDPVHFDALGQYVATNSFYVSMGKPVDESILPSISPVQKAYLNTKILSNVTGVPEPSTVCILVTSLAIMTSLRSSRFRNLTQNTVSAKMIAA